MSVGAQVDDTIRDMEQKEQSTQPQNRLRRKIDLEIESLILRVDKVEMDLIELRSQMETHSRSNILAHGDLLKATVELKVDLAKHTTNEERWQEDLTTTLRAINESVAKLAADVERTKPVVQTFNDINAFGRVGKMIIDTAKWMVPLFVGIGLAYVYLTKP